MSRIGKKPIDIPAGVKIEMTGPVIKISGPQGAMELKKHPGIEVKMEDNKLNVSNSKPDDRQSNAMHGTIRALLNNMIKGVSNGFQKELQIFGTGYNVKEQGGKLMLQVGFANTVSVPIPKQVKVTIKTPATKGNDIPAVFTLSSPDKHALGQFASEVRKVQPPEPYQGKGIRFADEHITKKVGKAFASGG